MTTEGAIGSTGTGTGDKDDLVNVIDGNTVYALNVKGASGDWKGILRGGA